MPTHPLSHELWGAFALQTRQYALLFLDPAGHIVGWSGAAQDILGYEEQEVLGKSASMIFTPEDIRRGIDRQELAIARQDSRAEDDRWHVRKDGTRIWASGTVEALRGGDGSVAGFVKVVRDRTDERMRRETADTELEESRRSRQRTLDFIHTLGHEMRNPLSPLLNSAQILQRISDDPRIRKAADIITNQVAALSRMAEDLMNVARMDSGQVDLRKQALDLREVVDSAVQGFAGLARERGVQVEAFSPPAELRVEIDRARFEQVLLNLLSNAIKYTPPGGHVWCKATQDDKEVVLRIQDTGIGIAPDVLPRIFDLFSRDREAAEREPSGLGIGLSIATQIVKLHGGSIQARSGGQGKGSEFTIRLPPASAASANTAAAARTPD